MSQKKVLIRGQLYKQEKYFKLFNPTIFQFCPSYEERKDTPNSKEHIIRTQNQEKK